MEKNGTAEKYPKRLDTNKKTMVATHLRWKSTNKIEITFSSTLLETELWTKDPEQSWAKLLQGLSNLYDFNYATGLRPGMESKSSS